MKGGTMSTPLKYNRDGRIVIHYPELYPVTRTHYYLNVKQAEPN